MGLDIAAYRQLKSAPSDWLIEKDGYEELDQSHEDDGVYLGDYDQDEWPDHRKGIPSGKVFMFEDSMNFRAGSYGGYSQWREWLAEVAGYPNAPGATFHPHCMTVWEGAAGPFSELINFSDCEGIIGPVVAAKLAQDCVDFDERAKTSSDSDYYYIRYREWRMACEMAADGGVIIFQ
jgi:hypothetical protein